MNWEGSGRDLIEAHSGDFKGRQREQHDNCVFGNELCTLLILTARTAVGLFQSCTSAEV
jgi:hypothetical protein